MTDSHVAWTLKRSVPLTPSPLLVGDELYLVSDNGIASCLDASPAKPTGSSVSVAITRLRRFSRRAAFIFSVRKANPSSSNRARRSKSLLPISSMDTPSLPWPFPARRFSFGAPVISIAAATAGSDLAGQPYPIRRSGCDPLARCVDPRPTANFIHGELPAMRGRVGRSSEVLSGTSLFCFAHGVGVATSAKVKATA